MHYKRVAGCVFEFFKVRDKHLVDGVSDILEVEVDDGDHPAKIRSDELIFPSILEDIFGEGFPVFLVVDEGELG